MRPARSLALLAMIMAVLTPGVALAGNCYAPSYGYPSYYTPYYPPTITKIVNNYIPFAIPTYSAVYTPGMPVPVPNVSVQKATPAPAVAAPGQAKAAMPQNDRLLQILDRFDQRLVQIEQRLGIGQPNSSSPPMERATDGQGQQGDLRGAMTQFVNAKCASCHGMTKQEASLSFVVGGQLVDPNQLSPKAAEKMMQRTFAGHPSPMPPKKSGIQPVTEAEYGLIMAWLAGRK